MFPLDCSSEWSEDTESKCTKKSDGKRKSEKVSNDKQNTNAGRFLWDHGDAENAKRIERYFIMKCDICANDLTFNSFNEVMQHYQDMHKIKGYITCCNQRFRRLGRVLQHCTWHETPDAFKCVMINNCVNAQHTE